MNALRPSRVTWTNTSVRKFAADRDPVAAIIECARGVVLRAQEEGWSGPPFDPFDLARLLRIAVAPSQDVRDARSVPVGADRLRIEYNPDRPLGRMRYSVAHEIAHTFFPDAAEHVRHRASKPEMQRDDWQLEMLCNIAAAEILMPIGSFQQLVDEEPSIDHLMRLRRQFDVSAEALLIRFVRLTGHPCFVFAASARADGAERLAPAQYRLDYAIPSRAWGQATPRSPEIPSASAVAECTAIGYTAQGDEEWPGMKGRHSVECVGIPPYPGQLLPRVVGIVRSRVSGSPSPPTVQCLVGDATAPRGAGPKLVVHVVNDSTPNWGGGFARVVRDKWPAVQSEFRAWAQGDRRRLRLGQAHLAQASGDVWVMSMVSQHGYGPSDRPRIRYGALAQGLAQAAAAARNLEATVHVPLIGCGQAGGRWEIVRELVDEALCGEGIKTTVYLLPAQPMPAGPRQVNLFRP